ncbi:ribonuclease H-like domain-containing protein [Tanacetum coccineum]
MYWVSDDEDDVEPIPKVEKKTVIPTATKKEFVKPEKPVRRSVSCPNVHKHMAPRAVLMKTGLKTVNTARPVNTVRSVNTGRPFSTARQNVNTVREKGFNAVKPSACWVWKPIKPNGASLSNSQLNDKGFVDSGCSRHMTGNIAHLSDFKDFDGGYVTFGGGAYGGRITGTGTIKTGNLDFDDVYFVKELKFNLFSVSQMCDKKNYVLFTDSECLVLSPNFKLPDENQILLKIPRQDNMYSFDMKNIVPKDSLTCLVAKATSEESMLWHRRLGHINFKNINKLVKENLVRDFTGSEGFHQVIDFLTFTNTDGEVTITAIIDGQSKTITEASLRRHLKLEDHDGITSIPNSKIFEQLALIGYQTDSDKLTFQKGVVSPNEVFSNMRRLTKGYTGVEIRLFPTMLTSPTPSSSPTRITSSPSLSSAPSTEPTFEPQPSPDAEYHVPSPNESPLHVVHSHGSDEGSLKLIELMNLVTKLSERIGVLEDDLKRTKKTYSAAFTKLILRIKKLESKVKTGKARKRARVVLSEDEEDDSSKQGRIDEDPNTYFHQDDEVVDDVVHDTAEERQPEDSTAGITVSTAPINISTARETRSTAGRVVYGRRSKEARKDKGKAIMTEPEPEKKSRFFFSMGLEEAIRLQEQVDKEERAQIARGEEIARQLLALDEERDLKNKPKSEAQARKNMIVYLKNQSNYKMKDFEGMSYDEIRTIFEKTTGKRKKYLPRRRTRSTAKKQMVEQDDEKEELKNYLDIVPREDVAVDVESLSIKYPIVDWKTYILQDVVELYRLVKERYSSSKPEGYDLMLWGDLHTLFEPDEESEIWMNQIKYNLISWSLCGFCGVHILLMQNGIAIHMLTEKKYPLSQEMISKMLSKILEIVQESTQAYELLKFIRSQGKK